MRQNKSLLPVSVRYFITPMIKVTNTKNWHQRIRGVAVTKPDHVVLKPLELVCRRNLKELGDVGYRSSRML
jgi:hypothetical protein